MKLSDLKTDSAAVEAGDWIGNIPGMPGLRLQVRGINALAYRNALDRRIRDVPRAARRRDGTLPPALADKISGLATADALLLGWEGLTDEQDVTLPYSRAMAEKLLTDPDYRAFRDAVSFAANQVAVGNDVELEGLLGNSAAPSNGNSTGAPAPGAS